MSQEIVRDQYTESKKTSGELTKRDGTGADLSMICDPLDRDISVISNL